ncbi:GNAT family N-acetyltransferase [Nonomuraea sp. NPDC050680]|uniref:GNAT family N-acetyltransferase n=1 Tax=Nonomuraea sp. NPDC050680 TaxID=3154630 RepID=UPI0033D9ECB3
MAADPRHAPWIARQAVTGPEGVVVGHAGFHGPPDEVGMVEIGYAVAPDFRRQGYGRAILIELLRRVSPACPPHPACASPRTGRSTCRCRGQPLWAAAGVGVQGVGTPCPR